MPLVKLSERTVQTLPPDGRVVEYRDDHRQGGIRGLCLRVMTDGAGNVSRRSYSVVWNVAGRTKRATIGEASTMTLAQARAEARRIRSSVALGDISPVRRIRGGLTLQSLTNDYLVSPEAGEWRESTRDYNERMLRSANRHLGNVAVSAITRADVQAMIDTMRSNRPGLAVAVASCLRSMFRWALRRDLIQNDPTVHVVQPSQRSRERVLSPEEIGKFWRACEESQATSASAFGLQLVLLTGARPGEVFGLKRAEISREEDGRWWTLPAERSKTGVEIRRPLSTEADRLVGLLEAAVSANVETLVLRGSNASSSWTKACKKVMERAGITNRATTHDLRRTARTAMSRLGVRFEVAEAVLGHAQQGVAGVYNRHGYQVEMRDALEKLAAEYKRLAAFSEGNHAGD